MCEGFRVVLGVAGRGFGLVEVDLLRGNECSATGRAIFEVGARTYTAETAETPAQPKRPAEDTCERPTVKSIPVPFFLNGCGRAPSCRPSATGWNGGTIRVNRVVLERDVL